MVVDSHLIEVCGEDGEGAGRTPGGQLLNDGQEQGLPVSGGRPLAKLIDEEEGPPAGRPQGVAHLQYVQQPGRNDDGPHG